MELLFPFQREQAAVIGSITKPALVFEVKELIVGLAVASCVRTSTTSWSMEGM